MTRFSEEDDSKKSRHDNDLEDDTSLARQKQDSLEADEQPLNAQYSDYDKKSTITRTFKKLVVFQYIKI